MTPEEMQDKLWLISIMRQLRRESWISQEELGEYVNMKQAAISRIESGAGNPTYLTLMKIAKCFGRKIDFV